MVKQTWYGSSFVLSWQFSIYDVVQGYFCPLLKFFNCAPIADSNQYHSGHLPYVVGLSINVDNEAIRYRWQCKANVSVKTFTQSKLHKPEWSYKNQRNATPPSKNVIRLTQLKYVASSGVATPRRRTTTNIRETLESSFSFLVN